MAFEFATAGQIVFGAGTLAQLPERVSTWGKRALLVTSPSAPEQEKLRASLTSRGVAVQVWMQRGEPSIHSANTASAQAREHRADFVVGLGGGSAIDLAKAVAGLAPNPEDILEYLEVVGRGRPLVHPPLPWAAIPTTAGTGAEVTRNAVLGVPEKKVKVSLRSPLLLARLALIDPALTLGLPRPLTATTGLDALTQLIEAYVSVRANPFTDALCAQAIPQMARALPRAFSNPNDLESRSAASFASLCSGIALANAGLGAVHGFAGAIGGAFAAAHGAICAALLPGVFAMNLRAIERREPNSPVRGKFTQVAQWLTDSDRATPQDGVEWLRQLTLGFGIPPLSTYGVTAADFSAIIAQSRQASSMKGNPLVLEDAELAEILGVAV